MAEPVELRPAFAWDCPECGREHFGRLIAIESPEELAALREDYGVDHSEEGEFLMRPDHVYCPSCNQSFASVDGEHHP